MYKISTERRFHELSYQFFRVCHGRCYRVHSQKMDWQALSRDKIKKVAVLQYSDLFWCGRGDSNLWPLESESNALSSWATTAHLWKSSLGRDSSYKIVKIGLVVNSWSVYREPPGDVPAFSRYAEQFLASCLTCHSCRRPVLYPAELWSHILRKRHADRFRREKKPAFCTENKPLLTGYILCVRLAVERTKAGAKPL